MDRESGCKRSPIWLIGDSPPEHWKDKLSVPLDSKHPARHNIWTSVVDGIQDRVFRTDRRRVDTSRLFVRNAVQNRTCKQAATTKDWSKLKHETRDLHQLLKQYKPPLVFSFGAFAFEFVNRSLCKVEERAYTYWNTKRLGEQFRRSVDGFVLDRINVLPLLHVSIARGKFLESHQYFTCDEDGNYFDYVANEVSTLLLDHKDDLHVWVN